MLCYDCKCETNDFVYEQRCTGGESHALYPSNTYTSELVCANRKICAKNKADAEAAKILLSTCPVCQQVVRSRQDCRSKAILDHLASHSSEDLAAAIYSRNTHISCIVEQKRG